MLFLYIDNYRGFNNTYVPITDVNFLVGENSTGKTSMLALLQVLCSPEFWFSQEFNNEEVELGTFKDIVSVAAKKVSSFRVGLLDSSEKSERNVQAFLLRFKEKRGLPTACRYDYYIGDKEINTIITENKIWYKFNRVKRGRERKRKFLFSMFKRWLSLKEDNKIGFERLKEKLPFVMKRSLAFIPSLMESKVKESKEKSELSVSFSLPIILEGLAWLGPIRSKPRRTYDEFGRDFSSEGEHTPYLVKTLLGSRKSSRRLKNFLKQFGKESDLFDSVLIKSFGRQAISPFSLNVLLQGKTFNIKNVGYGVSQSLPVIIEFFARSRNSWFAIQQPEIHLHPKAQAALGDIIFSLATIDKKKFLIETHSDYTIDRFRLNYRRKQSKVGSQVLFFERTKNQNKVHSIEIGRRGEYSEKQPKGFREFFIREELKLLGIK